MTPIETLMGEVDRDEWYSRPKGWELTPEGGWSLFTEAAERCGYRIVLEEA